MTIHDITRLIVLLRYERDKTYRHICVRIKQGKKSGFFPCFDADFDIYDEMIPIKPFLDAKRAVKEADFIIVGETTLLVNPIKNLIDNYTGGIVIVNQGETSADNKTDLIFNDTISKVLSDLNIQDMRYNQ